MKHKRYLFNDSVGDETTRQLKLTSCGGYEARETFSTKLQYSLSFKYIWV